MLYIVVDSVIGQGGNKKSKIENQMVKNLRGSLLHLRIGFDVANYRPKKSIEEYCDFSIKSTRPIYLTVDLIYWFGRSSRLVNLANCSEHNTLSIYMKNFVSKFFSILLIKILDLVQTFTNFEAR